MCALQFNGSSSYLTMGNVLPAGANARTIKFSIMIDAFGTHVPLFCYSDNNVELLDGCEAEDWDHTAKATPEVLNSTNFIQDSNSLDLGKILHGDLRGFYTKTLAGTHNGTGKSLYAYVDLVDLAEMHAGVPLRIYIGNDASNHYYRTIALAALSTDWNRVGGALPADFATTGSPDITQLNWARILIQSKDAATAIASGNVKVDYCHLSSSVNYQDWVVTAEDNAIAIDFGGHKIRTDTTFLNTGTWYRVVMTMVDDDSTGEFKVYINEVDQSMVTVYGLSGAINSATTGLVLGACLARSIYSGGTLAELSIWNRALSPIEIQSSACHKLIGGENELVGYWPINDAGSGVDVTIKDLTGNGNDGVMNNFAGNPWVGSPPITLGRAA